MDMVHDDDHLWMKCYTIQAVQSPTTNLLLLSTVTALGKL